MKTPGCKSWVTLGALCAALVATGSTAQAQDDLRVYWKDSLRFEGPGVKLRLGGRVQNDWAFFDQDDDVGDATVDGKSLNAEDGTEFRRARIYLSGTIQEDFEFKFQYDFAGGDADFKDVYVGLVDAGFLGGLRIGQFKEPFSLEELTSSNNITFMERSLMNGFAPSRSTGAMAHDQVLDGRGTWAAGVFRDSDAYGDQMGNGEWAWTGRATFLPVEDEEEDMLVHVGAGLSFRHGDDMRYRVRPEAHMLERYVSTRAIAGNDDTVAGNLEAAGVFGPFSVQSEFTMAYGQADMGSDPDFNAWYGQVSYALTGESRPYDKKKGVFKGIKPTHAYGSDEGYGAWEAALRYSSIDLDDGMVRGGKLDDITVGLNWYLNNNARVMFNYVYSDLDGWDDSGASFDGDTSTFMIRFQLAF